MRWVAWRGLVGQTGGVGRLVSFFGTAATDLSRIDGILAGMAPPTPQVLLPVELRVLHLEDSELDHELTLAHLARGGLKVAVRRVSGMIGEITASALEQSDGIGQVSGSVNELDRMTQQNAALVEQSATPADSLKDRAARLAQAVGTFRLNPA